MRSLMRYARQLGQRRTIAFYLSPGAKHGMGESTRHVFSGGPWASGRQRSLRELFSEAEYDPEDNDIVEDPHPNDD